MDRSVRINARSFTNEKHEKHRRRKNLRRETSRPMRDIAEAARLRLSRKSRVDILDRERSEDIRRLIRDSR